MNCPFCQTDLTPAKPFIRKSKFHSYYCNSVDCINDDMPRYQVNYYIHEPQMMVSCAFMIDKYYVQVDYENNTTTLSTLMFAFLMDPICLDRALRFDMTDLVSVAEKVKTLLLFS